MRRALNALAALILIMTLVTGCGSKSDATLETSVPEAEPSPTAVSSDNMTLSRAEFTYLFYVSYNNYLSGSRSGISFTPSELGIDSSKSLKEQTMSDGTTWFDFLTGVTLSSAEKMLVLCEGADAAGVTLDENDSAALDAYLAKLESDASGNGIGTDEYIASIFGDEVTTEVIREVYRKSLLADKYYEILASSVTVSEDECTAYLEANRKSLSKTDYMVYSFAKDDAEGVTADMARNAAISLSKITDVDKFYDFIVKCDGDTVTISRADVTVTGGAFSSTDAYCAWAYAQTAAGVTYVQSDETNGKYTVYLLTRAPYLDEYTSRSARIVLFPTELFGDDGYSQAEEVFAKWREDGSEPSQLETIKDSFPEKKEEGLTADGRLTENIRKSDVAHEVEEWLYSSARTVGDAAIVNTKSGVCIIYYESDGEYVLGWHEEIETTLRAHAVTAAIDELTARYSVASYSDVIADITA